MSEEDVWGFNILYHKMGMVLGTIRGSQVSSRHYADLHTGGWHPTFGSLEEAPEPEELVELFAEWPSRAGFELNMFAESVAGIFEDMGAFDYTDPAAYRCY
jgi:hypothetical protein